MEKLAFKFITSHSVKLLRIVHKTFLHVDDLILRNMDNHHIIKDAEKELEAQRQRSGYCQQDLQDDNQQDPNDKQVLLQKYLEQQKQLFEQQQQISEELQVITQKISHLMSNMN